MSRRRLIAALPGPSVGQYALPDPTPYGSAPTYPFPGSIYVQPVGSAPTLHPASSNLTANLVDQITTLYGDVNVSTGPVRYIVHGDQIATTTMRVNPGARWGSAPAGEIQVPIPPGLDPATGGDDDAIIWDVGNQRLYEFWVTGPLDPDGSWTCNTMGVEPTDGSFDGILPWSGDTTGLSSSTSAAHMSFAGMLITRAELAAGVIPHAIQLAIGFSGRNVAPATSFDSYVTGNSVPEGTRFYFPESVSMPSDLTPFGQMVFTALKEYGAFVFDTTAGTSVTTAIESPQPWTNYNATVPSPPGWPIDMALGYTVLANMPWSDLVAVAPASAVAICSGLTGPSAPTLSGTPGSTGTVNLSWTASESGTAGAVSEYQVFQGTSSGGLGYWPVATTSSTTTSISGLTSGTNYYFQVVAVTSDGTFGVPSNEDVVTAP